MQTRRAIFGSPGRSRQFQLVRRENGKPVLACVGIAVRNGVVTSASAQPSRNVDHRPNIAYPRRPRSSDHDQMVGCASRQRDDPHPVALDDWTVHNLLCLTRLAHDRTSRHRMVMRIPKHVLAALAFATAGPLQAQAHPRASRPILAVFAHPDDERVIGPLLSRLAREGRETHLVIATDGSQGVRDFANIPAGSELAAARVKEANCAATRLGVRQLHIIGLPDGGLASFEVLGKLRPALASIIDSLKPAVIITFGPEGGTGHPDHRLVGDVVTQIVQGDARYAKVDLLYASLPSERLRTAPPAEPTVNGMAAALLTVRVPFEERDLTAGREEFACHASQYTPVEMAAVNKYLAHAWNGTVWLRPWNGTLHDPHPFRR